MNYLDKLYNIAINTLILLSLISIWGSIVYRLYSLNYFGIFISLILAIISHTIIYRFNKTCNTKNVKNNKKFQLKSIFEFILNWLKELLPARDNISAKIKTSVITLSYLLFVAVCFYILFSNQTSASIISPWQVIPNYFFLFYGLATTILILNIIYKQKFSLFLIIIHYILSFSVALIIYNIGYGFDSFIHQATENLINKIGSVDPKPLYYLGQYSLVIIFHKLTFIPIIFLDKLLVPLLSAILIPIIFLKILKDLFSNINISLLSLLALLIFPFSFFIVTTPQNFAYLLLLIIILLSLICKNKYDLLIIYLISLAAITFQPIAGIPALLFSLLLTVYHSDNKTLKKYFYIGVYLLSVISLPAAFYILESKNNLSSKIINFRESIFSLPNFIIPGQENFILNYIYLYGFNIKYIILALAITGIFIAIKYRKECEIYLIYFLMSSALGISYLLTKNISFLFLVDYERNNFSDRILIIASLFLLPFIIVSIYSFLTKILDQNKIIKLSFLLFLVSLISTSLYMSYPRFDHYFNSHGVSTGDNDIKAVRWIEDDNELDYIVLANQQVSAAALREFGFVKYYNTPSPYQGEGGGEVFYYPIPTGGPMYQYYLDMVYKKPSRETMAKAMDLAGVSEGYFVLNKYWWAFPKILEEAKIEANNWEEIGNGEIFVFKYIVD